MDEQINSTSIPVQPSVQNPSGNNPSQQASIRSRLFKGRVNRMNYFVGTCLVLAGPVLIVFLMFLLAMIGGQSAISMVLRTILFILDVFLVLIAVVVMLSLISRRLHDLGKSDWYYLLNFIPIINIVFPFYLIFWPGNSAVNKYGGPPGKGVNIRTILGLP